MTRFFWGTIALFAMRQHYRREATPYALARGYTVEDVRRAAHIALDREFDIMDRAALASKKEKEG